MRRTDTSGWSCDIARSAAVLGDHWNSVLIRRPCLEVRRYAQPLDVRPVTARPAPGCG